MLKIFRAVGLIVFSLFDIYLYRLSIKKIFYIFHYIFNRIIVIQVIMKDSHIPIEFRFLS